VTTGPPDRLGARLVFAFVTGCASLGCVTMYALEAPPAPAPGQIPSYQMHEVRKGRPAAELQALFGAPLEIERRADGEVWHYRVITNRCTKVTKGILGFTSRVPPPDYPVARVVVRDGAVDAVEGLNRITMGPKN
jgi:hypothetical protein